jgi:hypothetical protein
MNSGTFIGERKMWRSSSEKWNLLGQIRKRRRFRGTEQKWANVPALLTPCLHFALMLEVGTVGSVVRKPSGCSAVTAHNSGWQCWAQWLPSLLYSFRSNWLASNLHRRRREASCLTSSHRFMFRQDTRKLWCHGADS